MEVRSVNGIFVGGGQKTFYDGLPSGFDVATVRVFARPSDLTLHNDMSAGPTARFLPYTIAAAIGLFVLWGLWAPPGASGQAITPDSTVRSGPGSLPLEPNRVFEMTTSEGSWLSVDVHPDGDRLVFGLLGDLYTLPIEGGAATRITSGMAFDSQPRYGPDGDRIVALRGPARAFRTSSAPVSPEATREFVSVPAGGGSATLKRTG